MSKNINPDQLDTLTALALGKALFSFLARLGEESHLDEFRWEDAGVEVTAGFIEIPTAAKDVVLELLWDEDAP